MRNTPVVSQTRLKGTVHAVKNTRSGIRNIPSSLIAHLIYAVIGIGPFTRMPLKGQVIMKTAEHFQSQKHYQALLESVTDYVIAVNRNYQIIMANNLFKNEFGIHPGGLCYKTWKNGTEKCSNCLVEKSFQDGQPHWNEEQVVMKDGTSTRMLMKSTPVKNEKGKILYVLEVATNITGKELLQKELNTVAGNLEKMVADRIRELTRSEEKYRTIFERSRDAIVLTDSNGRIIEINQTGLEMLGYKSKEKLLQLENAGDFFSDQKERDNFTKILVRNGLVKEYEARLKRGHKRAEFDSLITCNVILDVAGQISGYVNIIRDITNKKRAQEQIQRQNTRLSILNAIALDVNSSLDLDDVLKNTIDKILELLDADSVRIYLLDRRQDMLRLAAHKGLSDKYIKEPHVKNRMVGDGFLGETVITGETRVVNNFKRPADPYIDSIIEEGLQSTVYMPLTSKGEVVGVMCVSSHSTYEFSSDYLEFLTAVGNQVGMAMDNANLYENLKGAYGELKSAQEQVIQTEKLASLGKLAATIAHEINNPLAAVLNYIRLMIKLVVRGRFKPERLDDISRYLDTMEAETARCGEIVKNLLAFSRQSSISNEICPVDDIITKALRLITHDLGIKGIRLVEKIDPESPKIQCDPKQIQQALLNLIINASESMTKGGTLTVMTKKLNKEGLLEIVISDTGCGIPEENMKNIFEPFFTTKEEGKGVGLGLSVVYGIITRHKGTIEVKSKPGRGTTFMVRLPAADDLDPATTDTYCRNKRLFPIN